MRKGKGAKKENLTCTLHNPKLISMKELDKNRFYHLTFDASKSLICYSYLEESEEMTDEDFQRNMSYYAEMVQKYQPKRLLVDNKLLKFTVSPELQEWVVKEIAPKTASLQKMAFVLSDDLFAQVSMQQMMDEEGITQQYGLPKYFNNVKEAQVWLFAD